ncbi:hypothetical protein ACLOJK_034408, partial [Asimina triloba]
MRIPASIITADQSRPKAWRQHDESISTDASHLRSGNGRGSPPSASIGDSIQPTSIRSKTDRQCRTSCDSQPHSRSKSTGQIPVSPNRRGQTELDWPEIFDQ